MKSSCIARSSGELYSIRKVHGSTYQKNLILILLERLTISGFNFQLAYAMDAADKFGDIVVFLKDAEEGHKESWFIQTKHKETSNLSEQEKAKSITYESLFPKEISLKKDFNLCKYLISYSNIKRTFQGKKKLLIVTNRELASDDIVESSIGRIKIVPREVDKVLDLGGQKLGLEVNDTMIKEIQDSVNQEFIELRDAVVKLIKTGSVDQIIYNYKTPLADVIEISNNSIRFKSTFTAGSDTPELNEFFEALRQVSKDIKCAPFCDEQSIHRVFSGRSKNNEFPKFFDQTTVREFFRDLVFCTKQPDNLSSIINDDLQEWLKTWLRPECFGKMDINYLHKFVRIFETVFYEADTFNQRRMLELIHGERCLLRIRHEKNFKQERFCTFYINRQIREIKSIFSVQLSDKEFVEELSGKFDKQRFFILSADPGMGKTTVCQYMAHEAQKISNRLVYFIYSKRLKMENICNLEDALLVLGKVISEMHVEKIRNAISGNNKRIIVLFDGFDEIASNNRNKFLMFFKQLHNVTNAQIVVNCRTSVTKILETHFGVTAMNLVSFDRQDQIDFLRNLWFVSESKEEMFSEYAKHLLKLFHVTESRALYEFTGLLPTLKMLANIKMDEFQHHLRSNGFTQNHLQSQKTVRIVELYEQFIKQSFSNNLIQICPNGRPESKKYLSDLKRFSLQHQLLALRLLEIPFWQEVIKIPDFESEYFDFDERIHNENDGSPLVKTVNKQIKFVHSSYAEFLVAQFFYLHIEKFKNYFFGWRDNLFQIEKFKMVRRFFFGLIEMKQESKHLSLLRQPFENIEIQNWILEVHGFNTIKKLIRDDYGKLKHSLVHEVLIEAAKFYEAFKFLIEIIDTDLTVDYKGCSGETAILVAARYGDTRTVALLLEKNADVNCINCFGETPLHLALTKYHVDVVNILVKHNAKLTIADDTGRTPVHLAISRIRKYKLKFEYYTVMLDDLPNTATEFVDSKKRTINKLNLLNKMLKLMIEELEDVNTAYKHGKTLLHYAAEEGVDEAVVHLLNHSADVTALDINKQTPLHIATLNNHIEALELILEKSENVNVIDKDGLTPLHIAKREGFEDAVELLLEHEANLNTQDGDGQTPRFLSGGWKMVCFVVLLCFAFSFSRRRRI